jgi:MFS family permease
MRMTGAGHDITPSITELDAPRGVAARSINAIQLILLVVALCVGSGLRNLFSPLQESIRISLGLTDTQMGLIQGVAVSIPVTLLSVPFGWLIDRHNRVRLLCGLSVCWVVGTFMVVLAHGFLLLFLSRMLIGFGLFCAIPTAISLAADISPRSFRGRAIFPLLIGDIAGAAMAFSLGSALLGALSTPSLVSFVGLEPWRTVHLVFGIAGLIVALILMVALKEPKRCESASNLRMSSMKVIAELWSRRYLLVPLCVGQLGVVMADTAAGIWSAPLLARNYRLPIGQIGNAMGLVLLLTGLVGAAIGGVLADVGQNSRHRYGMMIGAVVTSAIAVPMSFFAIMPGAAGFVLMLSGLLLAGAVTSIITATALASIVPNELRGASLSVFGALNGLAGFGITPILVTAIGRMMGEENALGLALVVVTVLVDVASFFGFLLAAARLGHRAAHEF